MLRLKPKLVQDVYHPLKASPFLSLKPRINLYHSREWRLPVKKIARAVVVLWASWFLILGAVAAPTTQLQAAAATTTEERARLEAELLDLEKQISEYENQIVSYQKQGKSLKGEISTLNNKIAKLNLQIKAVDLTLRDLDRKLGETQNRIHETEYSIESNRAMLGVLLKNMSIHDQTNMMEMFLTNPKISDFFSDLNNISLLQINIRETIAEIRSLQEQLNNEKEQYALARADAATIKTYQAAQRTEADAIKKNKNVLLSATQGQESKYQQLVQEKEKTAAEIRKRIFQMLGGGQMSFGEAYQYAKFAEQATNVRAALILAVLDRESALGKNVGRCSYKTSMSPKNQEIFLKIVSELNLNPDTIMVSCANGDGVYGGAMGPAQFIPSTWMMYRDEISKITGQNPASPWNNADAFVATGLYLRDAGASGAVSIDQERKAAAKYYAGGNWSRFLWTYGDAVVTRAEEFQDDVDTLASGNGS